MNEVIAMIRRIGALRLAGVLGVGAGVALALTLVVARIAEPQLGVLYADIDLADAKDVIDRLEQDDIDYRTRERGGRISVLAPQTEIPRLRMAIAADGGAPEGGVGYEIFDRGDSFSATSFQLGINRLRALEGELARTISRLSGVRSARVHLVLPERELFARERQAASASIVVDAKSEIDQRTVRAIINLVASAAPGLSTSRVTVLDAEGKLLASGQGEDGFESADEKTAATEARLRRTLEDMLGPIVGPENLRVQVAAEMDFNKVTESAEIIDPDSQTVLSSVTVEEAANDSDPAGARGVTVANALPGAEIERQTLPVATSSNRRTEETTNYEMSRTTRTEVREQGLVRRLSVAVAVNARADGPRPAAEIARLETLARSAVGYSEARGDRVEVVEAAFELSGAAASAGPGPQAAGTAQPAAFGRLAEIGALAMIGLALVVFVLRPMFRAPRNRGAVPALARAGDEAGVAAALSEGAAGAPAAARLPERRIDIAQVAGQVKASAITKVAEVVKSHTEESASILKGWIRQAS
jgi:flagellar M-ring protein FliF